MLRIAIVANLMAYATVVSQPLFYVVALGDAQRALSAPAYIELRQRINAVMTKRVPWIYGSALATSLLVIALSLRHGSGTQAVAAAIALACLGVDVAWMVRENVPINGVVDSWSPTAPPDDWESYRAKWFAIFAYRQVLLGVGFLALLVGAVAPS